MFYDVAGRQLGNVARVFFSFHFFFFQFSSSVPSSFVHFYVAWVIKTIAAQTHESARRISNEKNKTMYIIPKRVSNRDPSGHSTAIHTYACNSVTLHIKKIIIIIIIGIIGMQSGLGFESLTTIYAYHANRYDTRVRAWCHSNCSAALLLMGENLWWRRCGEQPCRRWSIVYSIPCESVFEWHNRQQSET